MTDDIRFKCETLLVTSAAHAGPVKINKEDFDPEVHTLCDADGKPLEKVKPAKKDKPAPATGGRVKVTKPVAEEDDEEGDDEEDEEEEAPKK